MKKITLFAFVLLGMSSLNAQNKISLAAQNLTAIKEKHYPKSVVTNHAVAHKNWTPSVLTTIFSEDFASGLPATWAQVDSAGNGEIWTYTTAGPLNYPNLALASASAANGWMIFDDDAYGNNPTKASASLITPSFDCSSNAQVFLTLQEEFRQYFVSQGVIYVSNDSINWTAVHNVADGLAQDDFTANPFIPVIDISTVAANQATVYLKFTYRGSWDYFWQIDDIMVYEPAGIEISALSVNPISTEYSMIPLLQTTNLVLSGSVQNLGLLATTGGTALFEAVDSATNAVVFSQTIGLPNIPLASNALISTTNPVMLPAAGVYKVRITLSIAGDTNPLNDMIESVPTQITDSVYARDIGLTSTGFYNGAGISESITGQNYILNTTAQVTSISFYANAQTITTSFPLSMTIHNQTPGFPPGTQPIAFTDTIMMQPGTIPAGGKWITIPISTFSVTLSPGLYYFGINEDDANFQFGGCPSIFTLGTTWATWNSIPSPPAVNGWATLEDFGLNFTVMIRPNFGDVTAGIKNTTSISGFDVFPNPTNGIVNISKSSNDGSDYSVDVFNSIGQSVYQSKNNSASLTKIDLSGQPAGVYHVKINNNSGSFDKAVILSNN